MLRIDEKEISLLDKNYKNSEIYHNLMKKKRQLIIKGIIDKILSIILIIVLSPVLIVLSILIKLDDWDGSILYTQQRVTQYGKVFNIYKFRSMIENADKVGGLVTTDNDMRVTKIGKYLRKFRLDELPQLFNIVKGEMSFVGTRPEVTKFVECYDDNMIKTLYLPAGVTSLASIKYKDEEKLLKNKKDIDKIYLKKILPAKMKYNIEYLKNFNLMNDFKIILLTIFKIFIRR